jgi:hypothetical protein
MAILDVPATISIVLYVIADDVDLGSFLLANQFREYSPDPWCHATRYECI